MDGVCRGGRWAEEAFDRRDGPPGAGKGVHLLGQLGGEGAVTREDRAVAAEDGVGDGKEDAAVGCKPGTEQGLGSEVAQDAVESRLKKAAVGMLSDIVITWLRSELGRD